MPNVALNAVAIASAAIAPARRAGADHVRGREAPDSNASACALRYGGLSSTLAPERQLPPSAAEVDCSPNRSAVGGHSGCGLDVR